VDRRTRVYSETVRRYQQTAQQKYREKVEPRRAAMTAAEAKLRSVANSRSQAAADVYTAPSGSTAPGFQTVPPSSTAVVVQASNGESATTWGVGADRHLIGTAGGYSALVGLKNFRYYY
jgi:hypothetical protein